LYPKIPKQTTIHEFWQILHDSYCLIADEGLSRLSKHC
jgi:hypothetical protein